MQESLESVQDCFIVVLLRGVTAGVDRWNSAIDFWASINAIVVAYTHRNRIQTSIVWTNGSESCG